MLPTNLRTLLLNPETPNFAIHDSILDEGIHLAEVYIVVGSTSGEDLYDRDNYYEWQVAAFLDKHAAEELAQALDDWAIAHRVSSLTKKRQRRKTFPPCPLDQQFSSDQETGTSYRIDIVPLKG